MGIKKTLPKLHKSFFWYRMAKDCICYVKVCTACNKSKKPSGTRKASLGLYHAGYPMQRLHIDMLGPFTPSHFNNVYILIMCFAVYKVIVGCCDAQPISRNCSSGSVETLYSYLWPSTEIHSDQGQNFQVWLVSGIV